MVHCYLISKNVRRFIQRFPTTWMQKNEEHHTSHRTLSRFPAKRSPSILMENGILVFCLIGCLQLFFGDFKDICIKSKNVYNSYIILSLSYLNFIHFTLFPPPSLFWSSQVVHPPHGMLGRGATAKISETLWSNSQHEANFETALSGFTRWQSARRNLQVYWRCTFSGSSDFCSCTMKIRLSSKMCIFCGDLKYLDNDGTHRLNQLGSQQFGR